MRDDPEPGEALEQEEHERNAALNPYTSNQNLQYGAIGAGLGLYQ